jgi:hypothetical protein
MCESLFFHTTDINTIIQFVPNTPKHVLVTLATAVVMSYFTSFTRTGNGGTKTLSLVYLRKKKRNHMALDADFLVTSVSVPSCFSDTGGLPELLPLDKQKVFTHRPFVI